MVFPFLKASHKNPQQTAEEIGQWLQEHVSAVAGYNVINGFLNLVLNASTWMDTLSAIDAADKYGFVEATDKSPSVKVLFGESKTFRKVVLTCCRDGKGKFPVSSGSVEVAGRKIAEFVRGAGGKVVVEFAPVSADAVTIRPVGTAAGEVAWFTEVEVY